MLDKKKAASVAPPPKKKNTTHCFYFVSTLQQRGRHFHQPVITIYKSKSPLTGHDLKLYELRSGQELERQRAPYLPGTAKAV